MVIVGFCCRALSSALVVARERSDELIFSPPTTATRSPPATPPNVPVLATSELAKATAIRARKASVKTMPNFDWKKLRKDVIMAGRSDSVQVWARSRFASAERASIPAAAQRQQ